MQVERAAKKFSINVCQWAFCGRMLSLKVYAINNLYQVCTVHVLVVCVLLYCFMGLCSEKLTHMYMYI